MKETSLWCLWSQVGAQPEVRVKILARAGRDRKAARLVCAQLGTWARQTWSLVEDLRLSLRESERGRLSLLSLRSWSFWIKPWTSSGSKALVHDRSVHRWGQWLNIADPAGGQRSPTQVRGRLPSRCSKYFGVWHIYCITLLEMSLNTALVKTCFSVLNPEFGVGARDGFVMMQSWAPVSLISCYEPCDFCVGTIVPSIFPSSPLPHLAAKRQFIFPI